MDEILANINKKLEEIDRKKVSIGIDEEHEGNGGNHVEVPDPIADFVDADENEANGGRYSPTKSAAPRRKGSTTEVSALYCIIHDCDWSRLICFFLLLAINYCLLRWKVLVKVIFTTNTQDVVF